MLRCNRCHRPMPGTTAYDGACACGGLIEVAVIAGESRGREVRGQAAYPVIGGLKEGTTTET